MLWYLQAEPHAAIQERWKIKCIKDVLSFQDLFWTYETLILYLLTFSFKQKNPNGNKCSQNGLSLFWIQYKCMEKSHSIADYQLALLKL